MDFKNKHTINEIKNVKAADGKTDFFTEGEKLLFFDNDIGGDVEKAKVLAELLAKVKEAENTIKENVSLHDEIKKYDTDLKKPTKKLAYRIIEADNFRITKCLIHLTNFFKVEGKEKTKAEAEEKIKLLNFEKIKQLKLKGEKSSQRLAAIEKLKISLDDLKREEANLKRKNALRTLLTWDRLSTTEEIEFKGASRKLSDIGTAFNVNWKSDNLVNDYSGANLTDFDNSGNMVWHRYNDGESLAFILNKANKHLTDIDSHNIKLPPTYVGATDAGNVWDNRVYNAKHNISCSEDEFGIQFILKVIKDIGAEKIKKIIAKKVSGNDKTKLENFVDNLFKLMESDGVKFGIGYGNQGASGEIKGRRYDAWRKNMLKEGFSDYPYTLFPDWPLFFELMHKVFPKNSTDSYLFDKDDNDYLGPSDSNKEGWDNIGVGGYWKTLPSSWTGGMVSYAKKNASTETLLLKQTNPYILPNNLKFGSLVNIWWNIFEPHINISPYGWKKSKSVEMTGEEAGSEKIRDEIRYVKTMREVAKALEITNEISELDDIFLEIADRFEKSGFINPRNKVFSDEKKLSLVHYNSGESVREAIHLKKLWSDIGDRSSVIDISPLLIAISRHESRKIYLESEKKSIEKQIIDLANEEVNFDINISTIDNETKSLQLLIDFEDAPKNDKVEMFNKLWDKGKDSKWKRLDVKVLIGWIKRLKIELDDNEYADGKYDEKKTRLEKIETEIAKWTNTKDNYTLLGNTDIERIKNFKKNYEGKNDDLTLAKFQEAFEKIAEQVELEPSEEASLTEIKKAITSPQDYEDKEQTVELKVGELKNVLEAKDDATVQEKLEAWKNIFKKPGTNTIKTKENIAELIKKTGKKEANASEANSKWDKFKQHLAIHPYEYSKFENNAEQWDKFVASDPKVIIGTILYFNDYEYAGDEDKKKLKKEINDAKTAALGSDKKLDSVDANWDTEKQEFITRYLYRKAVGNPLFKTKNKEQKDEEPKKGPGKDEETQSSLKDWFIPREGHYWKPIVTYAGIAVVLIGIGVAIFWKNIAEWWNGPAEEAGEIGDSDENKEESEE